MPELRREQSQKWVIIATERSKRRQTSQFGARKKRGLALFVWK